MSDSVSVVSSRIAFEGRVFDVRVDDIRYGQEPAHRIDVIQLGHTVAIVALDDSNRIALVRQYRHAVRAYVWEIPAGHVDEGEAIRDAAVRELREETGYAAGRIEPLITIFTTPGVCDETQHLFLATDLRAGEQALDQDERIDVELVSIEDAWRLVTGQVSDAKTALALLWLKARDVQMRSESSRS
jgi:8-oxo-dGTP pyrophosphatase MutT (NUDIX family)